MTSVQSHGVLVFMIVWQLFSVSSSLRQSFVGISGLPIRDICDLKTYLGDKSLILGFFDQTSPCFLALVPLNSGVACLWPGGGTVSNLVHRSAHFSAFLIGVGERDTCISPDIAKCSSLIQILFQTTHIPRILWRSQYRSNTLGLGELSFLAVTGFSIYYHYLSYIW